MRSKVKRPLILDTSVLIVGFDPNDVRSEEYTVSSVEKEIKRSVIQHSRLKAAIKSGDVEVLDPKPRYLKKVSERSEEMGDTLFLSGADIEILALALEFKEVGKDPIILTEDYSIQNMASSLGIAFKSLSNLGIRYLYRWILYCPACKRSYPPEAELKRCEVCGTELKHKPTERRIL